MIGVVYAQGTNCHEETIVAIKLAGGNAELAIIEDLAGRKGAFSKYSALVFPGGFSWGDHCGAGRIEAQVLIAQFGDELQDLVSKIPILGICNGFQVLVEAGILPSGEIDKRRIALMQNTSARFESRWVNLAFLSNECIFTNGLYCKVLRMPVAHGEGRLYASDSNKKLFRPVCYYADNSGFPTMKYHENPNGSQDAIAGICDKSGLTFGLMPHPERAVFAYQGSTDGLVIFKNLIHYCNS